MEPTLFEWYKCSLSSFAILSVSNGRKDCKDFEAGWLLSIVNNKVLKIMTFKIGTLICLYLLCRKQFACSYYIQNLHSDI